MTTPDRKSAAPATILQEPLPAIHKADARDSIGGVIRQLRKERGMSQEELARETCMDRTTIARLECGIFKSLSVGKLERIAQAMGMDLQALLLKAESAGPNESYRGHLNRAEFVLEYPEAGFRIASHIPKRKEFFFGKIEIEPQKTIPSAKLPHPEQVYLHALEGKILLAREHKEFLLKPGDCFAFTGFGDYEFYNPEPVKTSFSLFITYPSFVSL